MNGMKPRRTIAGLVPQDGFRSMKKTSQRIPSSEGMLTIGALSRATGVPVETIRTWERRYRSPVAYRKSSGHRLYPLSSVSRLRRVAEAISRGHRPAEVLPISEEALNKLLIAFGGPPVFDPNRSPVPSRRRESQAAIPDLMDSVRHFDGERIRRILELQWARLGPVPFLDKFVAPFLVALGEAWVAGRIDIRHEHFASGRIADFLAEARRPYEESARGPWVALATLPGEPHEIGTLMASVTFAVAGWRVIYLGRDTPQEQLALLARDADLRAVAIGVSKAGARAAAGAIRGLRRALPHQVELIVGGEGATGGIAGVRVPGSLVSLEKWAKSLDAQVGQ
jgi:DNA-binding transcriptional MerR regulator/methylmalonyl-CoA mutase cobalamin-binding subunit